MTSDFGLQGRLPIFRPSQVSKGTKALQIVTQLGVNARQRITPLHSLRTILARKGNRARRTCEVWLQRGERGQRDVVEISG